MRLGRPPVRVFAPREIGAIAAGCASIHGREAANDRSTDDEPAPRLRRARVLIAAAVLGCSRGLVIMAKADVEVSDLDQICAFNRLLHERNEFSAQIELEESELQGLEDAEEELLLSTGDEDTEESLSAAERSPSERRQPPPSVEVRIGSAFFALPQAYVEKYVAKRKEEVTQSLGKLREQRAAVIRTMTQLKQTLYAKFGDAINLEES